MDGLSGSASGPRAHRHPVNARRTIASRYTLEGADGVLETRVHLQWADDTREPATMTVRVGSAKAYAVARSGADAPDDCTVTVTAAALAEDLAFFPDRLDPAARVDSGLVTCWPGSDRPPPSPAPLDEVALTIRPVLRSVDDVVGR